MNSCRIIIKTFTLLTIISLINACNGINNSSPTAPVKISETKPTYDLPPTQQFPTPMITPTRGPTPQLQAGMEINEILDMPFKSDQKLDIYWPVSQNNWPVVVILHGGGIFKEGIKSLSVALAKQGTVVFTPEYLSYEPPPDKNLTAVTDVACAVRYARAYAGKYGGDPDQVTVVGHSAGGAYGAVITLAGDQFQIDDCLVDEGSPVPDIFIGLDGAYDILRYTKEEGLRLGPPDEWVLRSPYTYIGTTANPGNTPFYLFVGKETELLQDAQAFRDSLLAHGYFASLTQFPGIDHMRIASGAHANTIWSILAIIKP